MNNVHLALFSKILFHHQYYFEIVFLVLFYFLHLNLYVISQLGLSPEQEVNLTIEEASDSLLSIMDKIGAKAQAQGLTEEKLQELLADES